MKLLVTRHDQSRKSVFVREDKSPRQAAHAACGFYLTQAWATEEVPGLLRAERYAAECVAESRRRLLRYSRCRRRSQSSSVGRPHMRELGCFWASS